MSSVSSAESAESAEPAAKVAAALDDASTAVPGDSQRHDSEGLELVTGDCLFHSGYVSGNSAILKTLAAEPYVEEMLNNSPMGLRMTKEGLTMAIDASSLEAAMAIENRNQLMCSRTSDAREGMAAFIEKRKPNYTGS